MIDSHHKRDITYLAIDQGGHASRAILYDAAGVILESSYAQIATHEGEDNVVEHDAHEFVDSVLYVVKDLLARESVQNVNIASAGLACQRSSIVCWERNTGRALSPVISWQDRRTATQLDGYRPHVDLIREQTGLMLNPHYGATKMRWCLDNLAELDSSLQNGELVISPVASFLLFHLLQERPIVIDPANAGRTLLFDYRQGDWSPDLLEIFGIDEKVLPSCVTTQYDYGHISVNNTKIPLQICTGDQSAALFFCGQPRQEDLYINAGTGAFVQQVRQDVKQDSNDGLLKSIVYSDNSLTLLVIEGTVNGAGRALQWFAEKQHEPDYVQHLETWLEEVDDPPLFINTISGVGSPFWFSAEARFDRECSCEEGFVAIIESIVFLLVSNIRLFDGFKRILISGGLSSSDRFCQYLADLSGSSVVRQSGHEATAKGLFVLLSGRELPAQVERRFDPKPNQVLESRYAKWHTLMIQASKESRLG